MLTHLKYTTPIVQSEPGTAKIDGEEVYPCTPTLLKRLGFTESILNKYTELHKQKLNPSCIVTKELRDYQKQDALFLANRKCAGCFNQQRTGKTPTICEVVNIKKFKKVLIVCPSSLVLDWKQEFTRWTGLDCIAIQGTIKKKQELLEHWTQGAVISYESLREVFHKKESEDGIIELTKTGMLNAILKHKDIECVIVDEAHRIANRKTAQAAAVFSLCKIPNRYALTGTPAISKQEDIFSILHFLFPTIFSSYWRFIDYYFNKREVFVTRTRKKMEITGLRWDKTKELQEFLDAIATQRKRKDVMEWLPDKEYHTIKLEPTKEQFKYLAELDANFETEDLITINVLDNLIKERQICLSPLLVGLKGNSPKLEWLQNYIKDYPDKSILIFSKFTKWLELLNKELPGCEMITGNVSYADRKRICEQFQNGNIKRLLINIDAGKEGLTLDKAEASIFTDKYPPVGVLEQAEDRFVATKEELAHKEHIIYSLIMQQTYEENIEESITHKLKETDLINDYQKYLERRSHVQ